MEVETIMEQPQQNNASRNLILFPIPLQGHVTPMFHLANLLHSKSFSITIIQTRYNSLDPTHFPHFTFHFLEDGLSKNTTHSLAAIRENCENPFRECLACILREPFGCLITDSLWYFAGDVAESFNIPRIVLRTSSMSAFVVNDYLPVLRQKGYFLPDTKPDEAVHEIPPFKVMDLPTEERHDLLTSAMQQIKTSHAVICNTFDELESSSIAKVRQSILSIPIFPVGPLHNYSPTPTTSIWTQDHTSISWLNTQAPNSVLYVSFGSVVTMSKTDFLEIAWALADSQQPFLWVVRTGLSQGGSDGNESNDVLPEGYLEMVKGRGHIVKWAPQVKVLSHPSVGGFWTHCGWNSTLESICGGVPMMCLPFLADQAMNARHVSDVWKIGVRLEKGMRRNDIDRVLREMMAGVEGEEMRNRARVLKECARKCTVEGGSSVGSLESLVSFFLSL